MTMSRTNSEGAASTRRQAFARAAIALGGLAAGSVAWAKAEPKMPEAQSTGTEGLLTYLHQEIDIEAKPARVYDALLDSKQFAAFTKMPADVRPEAGAAFSLFGGLILGRNVELAAPGRIVQAWRPASWDPGVYSMVHFEIRERESGSTVVLDHTGFPEGDFRHLDPGWHNRYWDPLKKYLS